MGKIYLIRHGETDSNKGHQFQGRMDWPLNGAGMAQAAQMAKYMQQFDLDAIYTSSMVRAKMTAAQLAMAKGMSYKSVDLLKEISFGDWEGLSFDEIRRRWPGEMDNFLNHPTKWVPPHGETFEAAGVRAQAGLQQIFDEAGHDKNIAIVAHGGIIRLLLCSILGIPLDNMWRLNVYNVSVSKISDWQGSLVVDAINITDFLTQGQTLPLIAEAVGR